MPACRSPTAQLLLLLRGGTYRQACEKAPSGKNRHCYPEEELHLEQATALKHMLTYLLLPLVHSGWHVSLALSALVEAHLQPKLLNAVNAAVNLTMQHKLLSAGNAAVRLSHHVSSAAFTSRT